VPSSPASMIAARRALVEDAAVSPAAVAHPAWALLHPAAPTTEGMASPTTQPRWVVPSRTGSAQRGYVEVAEAGCPPTHGPPATPPRASPGHATRPTSQRQGRPPAIETRPVRAV
jgi:hypothetical protein